MSFVITKIGRRLDEIRQYIYEQQLPLSQWEVIDWEGPQLPPRDGDWKPFTMGDPWGSYDRFFWFRTQVKIPPQWKGRKAGLYLSTPTDVIWKKAAEYLVFLHGEPLQGADIFHHEVILTDSAQGGETLELLVRAFSGFSPEPNRTEASLVLVNEACESLYYDMNTAYQALLELDPHSLNYQHKYTLINHALNLLDLRTGPSPEFYRSAAAAGEELRQALFQSRDQMEETVSGVGHSHIDVAWTWRLRNTRFKAARNFTTALRMMDRYPDYRLIQSQPQLYQFVKEDQPSLLPRIKEKIRQGQWEAEGGMWVESDCVLPSGESLIRQFLYGKAFFRDELGVDSRVVWLPDAFGFSAAMPQIMKKCGMDYFVTSKLSWNQVNDIPMDTFLFVGLDGTKMPAYFLTTPELRPANIRKELPYKKTYNGMLTPKAVHEAWDNYKQKAISSDALIAYGWGDGGGGPDKNMLETGRGLSRLDQYYHFRTTRVKDYLDQLFASIPDGQLPRWVGELYLECHRGTYTAEASAKRNNRRAEFALSAAEKFSSMAALKGLPYPRKQLEEAWKLVLLNQFHDIIPGSSIKEVYDDSKKQYQRVFELCEEITSRALACLTQDLSLEEHGVVLYNPSPMEADQVVELPGDDLLCDEKGDLLPAQRTADGKRICFCWDIPANGCKILFHTGRPTPAKVPLPQLEQCCENRFYRIRLDEKGNLSSIFDKQNQRELLMPGRAGNVFQVFEDKPLNHNAWDIDYYYEEKMWEVDDLQSVEVVEHGAVRTIIRVKKKFLSSAFSQDIILYRDIPRIDFRTTVDWKQQELLLKTAFPLDIHANTAKYEIQFGHVERSTSRNTSWEQAKFEVYGHKWADLSEGNFGVSLLNDCKYGYDVRDSVLRLTLIKSPIYPNPVSGQEIHHFTYSLYAHQGDLTHGDTLRQGYMLNVPVYPMEVGGGSSSQGSTPLPFAQVDTENVLLDTIKLAEDSDDLVLRLFEAHNSRTPVRLTLGFDVSEAWETNMLEQPEQQLTLSGRTLELVLRPFEVKTIRLKRL